MRPTPNASIRFAELIVTIYNRATNFSADVTPLVRNLGIVILVTLIFVSTWSGLGKALVLSASSPTDKYDAFEISY